MRRSASLWVLVCVAALSVSACGGDVRDGEAGRSGGGESGERSAFSGKAAREPAPAWELQRLDGQPISLASLRGKTVVIDFWATWCPPCEFQVPELNAFFEAHRDDPDVAVVGISIDTDGSEVVEAWMKEKGVRYPVAIGSEDLARRYGAMGFPTLVVITPEGEIDERHVGLIERADLESALARQREAAQAAS